MEIERKWMVTGWPEGLPLLETYHMDQGYISVRPTVRIRREALEGGKTALVLCFKGAAGADGLSRKEIETEIDQPLFGQLEDLIGKPLIQKVRKTYLLPDGNHLEVNCVDEGLPSAFWYAEIEYRTEEEARAIVQRCMEEAQIGSLEEFATMDEEAQKEFLRVLRFREEISIQQISRITGVNRGIIQRL